MNGGARIERAQACAQALDRLRLGEIGLRYDQPVGEDHLLACFRRPFKRVETAHGIDHRHDHFDVEFPAQCPIGSKRLQDRAGIGEPAGLDHDPPELRQRALRAFGDEIAQRVLQVGAHVAAQAAVAEQRDVVARGAHQRVVDADAAELVDDDRGAFALGACEKAAQQRRFAGAEKAGQDGDRNLCAACVLEPAPEGACVARGKKIEHGLANSLILRRRRSRRLEG